MNVSVGKVTDKDLAEFGIVTPKEEKFGSEPFTGLVNDATSNMDTNQTPLSSSTYPGNISDDDGPLEESGYRALEYDNPAIMLAMYHKAIREQQILLHPWQLEQLEEFGDSLKTASAQHPYKLALCAANGSGKDAFIVAPFTVWFALVNVRSLTIITSSSGSQLTAQTENYIRSLAQSINEYHGATIFRIRQRFIKCLLTGSEIRMFATDEEGKAEGYHPLEPNAKMAIIVNEAKSVSEDIFRALRRCTGYSHWLNVSTPGAPTGSFYESFNRWPHTRRIDYALCHHLSEEERLEDYRNDGEHSSYYRSKWLALFTTQDTNFVITKELIDELMENKPELVCQDWPDRIGIDLSAGGDEITLVVTKGNRLKFEFGFREKDTTITADRLDSALLSLGIKKTHEYIFADDGGVGHAIIDMLVRKGWNINRVINQSRAIRAKQFGNRGAELWDRVKRLFEERVFNPDGFSDLLIKQLTTRRYKQQAIASGRTFLESKKEAKANGFKSPDRADAFVLSLTGVTLDDFLLAKATPVKKAARFTSNEQLAEYFEDNITYKNFNEKPKQGKRIFASLSAAINDNTYANN